MKKKDQPVDVIFFEFPPTLNSLNNHFQQTFSDIPRQDSVICLKVSYVVLEIDAKQTFFIDCAS